MAAQTRRLAVLIGGAMLACTVQAVPRPSARPAPPSEESPVFGGFTGAGEPNSAPAEAGRTDTKELFFKMMLSVAVVIALAAAALYASKKLLGRITNLTGKRIKVVETVYLGPRKAVHLLDLDGRRFLIGSTNEAITRLAELPAEPQTSDALCGQDVELAAPGTAGDGLAGLERMWSLEGPSRPGQAEQGRDVPAPRTQSS